MWPASDLTLAAVELGIGDELKKLSWPVICLDARHAKAGRRDWSRSDERFVKMPRALLIPGMVRRSERRGTNQ
jgi:hypothetical protein